MKATSKAKREKINVGDRVWIPWGGGPKLATVIEDRGYIGVNGRRLLRITMGEEENGVLLAWEIPEADVKLYRRARTNGHAAAKR